MAHSRVGAHYRRARHLLGVTAGGHGGDGAAHAGGNISNFPLYFLSCATRSGIFNYILLKSESFRHVSRIFGDIPCLVQKQDHGVDRPPLGARRDHRAPGPDRRRPPLRPQPSASSGLLPGSGPLYGPTTRGGSPPASAAAFPTCTPDYTDSAPPRRADPVFATSSTEKSTD
jgi:hypothetical protein